MTPRISSIDRPPSRRRMRVVTVVLCLAVAAGCSSGGSLAGGKGSEGSDARCSKVVDGKVTVVTKSFDFEPQCLTSAGPLLTVRYDNAEKGISHNFHLRGAKSASGSDRTDLKVGPDVQTITYVGLEPGRYTYTCDLHPAMKGSLTVTAAAP